MADSTSVLVDNLISSSQAQKELTANELFNVFSNAALYGRRNNTSGLTWYYFGGRAIIDGVVTAITNGTKTLTASATNYLSINPTVPNTVNLNTTNFIAGEIPLYKIVTSTNSITSYEDYRYWAGGGFGLVGGDWATITMSDANLTLSAVQVLSKVLNLSGTLSTTREIIYPTGTYRLDAVIINNTSQSLLIKNSTPGTTVTIPSGKVASIITNGTNVFTQNSYIPILLANANQAAVTIVNANSDFANLTFSSTPTQAELEAFRDKAEILADDVRNVGVLLNQIRNDLVTSGIIKGSV